MKTLTLLLSIAIFTTLAQGQEPARVRLLNTLRWGYHSMPYELDGKKISVKRNHYAEVTIVPGGHTICFRKDKPIPFSIAPGETAYFGLTEMALGWGGFRVARLSNESGEFEIGHLEVQPR